MSIDTFCCELHNYHHLVLEQILSLILNQIQEAGFMSIPGLNWKLLLNPNSQLHQLHLTAVNLVTFSWLLI